MKKPIMLAIVAMLLSANAFAAEGVTNMSPYIDTGFYSPGFIARVGADTLFAYGYSDTVAVIGAEEIVGEIFCYTVAQGGTLFVQLQGSNDNVHFTNLSADNDSLAISIAGNYGMVFSHAVIYRYYRMYFNEVENGSSWIYDFRVGGKVDYGK